MPLPVAGWCVTGFLFHLKPGWSEASDQPALRLLPLDAVSAPPTAPPPATGSAWLAARRVRTVLGEHLLVRTSDGRRRLDPTTGAERPPPSEPDLRRLIDDALAGEARYGPVESVEGLTATTRPGVVVTLDWQRLALSQRARDTAVIDAPYRIHSLKWTGVAPLDRALATLGLAALAALAIPGARLVRR